MKKVVCGINLLYQNFATHGKLDLWPEIIQFLCKLAMKIKKAVGFLMEF
jgi:hypothetical protein